MTSTPEFFRRRGYTPLLLTTSGLRGVLLDDDQPYTEPNLRVPDTWVYMDKVVCTDCDRFYDDCEYVITRVICLGTLQGHQVRRVEAKSVTSSALHTYYIIKSRCKLVRFEEVSAGVYKASDSSVITVPSINAIDSMTEIEWFWLEKIFSTTSSTKKKYYRTRLSLHRVCCCVSAPQTFYVCEEGMRHLFTKGSHTLSTIEAEHRFRTFTNVLNNWNRNGLSLETQLATVRCFVASVGLGVTGQQGANHFSATTQFEESVSRETLLDTGATCELVCRETSIPCVEPPRIEGYNHSNDLQVVSSKGVTLDSAGIHFTTPYSSPESLNIIGPHIAACTVRPIVKSTASAEAAFWRLYKIRGSHLHEQELRINQDLFLAHHFYLDNSPLRQGTAAQRTQFSRAFRRYCVTHKANDGWGIHHTQITRFLNLRRVQDPFYYGIIDKASVMLWDFKEHLLGNLLDYHDLIFMINNQARPDLVAAFAADPHIKRVERMEGYQTLLDNPAYFTGTRFDTPEAKVKNETVKYKIKDGKAEILPRQFISLGVTNTILEGFTAEILKKLDASAERLAQHNFQLKFLKEGTIGLLDSVFQQIAQMHRQHPSCTPWSAGFDDDFIYYLYHSDDGNVTFSATVLDEQGSVRRAMITLDVDIATCDASHGPSLFCFFLFVAALFGVDAKYVIDQLYLPFVIKHPDKTVDENILFKPLYGKMYTGFWGTTSMNNKASWLIAVTIISWIKQYRLDIAAGGVALTIPGLCAKIQEVTGFCGYEITVEPVVTYLSQTIDFSSELDHLGNVTLLKHYPARVTGSNDFVAIPCLGRLLRNFGVTDLKEPPEDMSINVVRGFLSQHSCVQSELLARVVLKVPLSDVPLEYEEITDGKLNINLIQRRKETTVGTTLYRYKLNNQADFELDLEHMFRDLTPRLVLAPALLNVLKADYGLKSASSVAPSN